jgi:predicted outer membrane repeat protein
VNTAADIFDGSCDPAGAWLDQGYNVASDGTCLRGGPGDVDHKGSLTSWLSPLGYYGGPTETMPPVSGSPAIGVVPDPEATQLNGMDVTLCPTADQRGAPSNPGHSCNAGAVQGGGALFAYASATTSELTGCPETSTTSQECTLAEALSLVTPGGTVYLATAGNYFGNWAVATSGTSSSAPVTMEPAPGVTNPTLDGNSGNSSRCQTSSCDGSVLTIGAGVYAQVQGVTVQGGDNATNGDGGAISNAGALTVTASTFSANTAGEGGAIYNGYDGYGSLSVSASTFSGNTAEWGGAIFNFQGTATVSAATFSANTGSYDGGAISSVGTLTVTASTFSANTAGKGGAISNGAGALTVTASTFSANTASELGSIVFNPIGSVWAAADIFDGSCYDGSTTSPGASTWNDAGYNVARDSSCLGSGPGDVDYGGGLTGLLGQLSDNGGPTETILPVTGNPAMGLVPSDTSVTLNAEITTLCPSTDQRGVMTDPDQACNAGAVQPVAQTISFAAPTSGTVGDSATLSASGGASGNPVVFSVDDSSDAGVCNLSGTDGTTVHYQHAGSCVLDANQAGDADYLAAPTVTQAITVTASTTTTTSPATAPPGGGDVPVALPPTTTTTTSPTTTTTAVPATTTTVRTRAKRYVMKPVVRELTRNTALSGGQVRLALGCSGAACRGSVKLWYGHVLVGEAAYSLLAGAKSVFTVALRPGVPKLLGANKSHELLLTQTVTVVGGSTVRQALRLSS